MGAAFAAKNAANAAPTKMQMHKLFNFHSYIEKARSAIYLNKSEQKPLLTWCVFKQLATKRPEAARLWLQRLGDIGPEQCQNVFNRIPPSEISEIAIEFAMTLLELNKKRLLEVKP